MKLGDLYKSSIANDRDKNVVNDKMKDVELRGMEPSAVYSFVSLANHMNSIDRGAIRRIKEAISDYEAGIEKSVPYKTIYNTLLQQRVRWMYENMDGLNSAASTLAERFGKSFAEIRDIVYTMGKKFGHQSKEDKAELLQQRMEESEKLWDAVVESLKAIGFDRHVTGITNTRKELEDLMKGVDAPRTPRKKTGLSGGKDLSPEEIAAMQVRDASESGYDDNASLRGSQTELMDRIVYDQISRLPVNFQAAARREIADKGNKAVALQAFMRKHNL